MGGGNPNPMPGIREITIGRDTNCTITIPDDHDVGHPNLWGAGGKKSRKEAVSEQPSAVSEEKAEPKAETKAEG